MKIKLWMSTYMNNTQQNLHVFITDCLYLKKCEREKQKTEIDCQIYKMRMRLENSFARNSFKRGKFFKKYFRHCIPHHGLLNN